ncbi:dimethyladenosine transferase [Antricoccus suffuscus]|uniref:Ribosomal RNA small subunit methyltransferase A n=1 Tax=Antricoccus suffuscus TaxID=1629062 RepID=A0A2T0ZZZ1_9ACTN|nr:16S rRNA (adenine(1518)-N(6)/adenine(1519)-N(6))-dimethyltransferase RsmA [Antricoccus suffuscus]PRZ41923.1 dimethyladenosine transferase [Antricoccus suffuscus]
MNDVAVPGRLLGATRIRELAAELGIRPTKTLGQNFVHDGNTVRRIVSAARLLPDDVVLEVGPGLGSLTLGLLDAGHRVVAVEIDSALAGRLAQTVQELQPDNAARLVVVPDDAMTIRSLPEPVPTALVANLPYNISVPVLLHMLATFPSIDRILVMVQSEVARRLAAKPGSKVYGSPSAKAAWYADVSLSITVSRSIFWPAPNVDSSLVSLVRRATPPGSIDRAKVFAIVDLAFAQRRKMLRSALAALDGLGGSSARASELLVSAGVDPMARGETLGIEQFVAIAMAHDRRTDNDEGTN